MESLASFYVGEMSQLKASNSLMVQEVNSQRLNIITSKKEMAKISQELSDMKNVKTIIKTEYITLASGIETEYIHDTIEINKYDTSDRSNYIPKGSKIAFSDDWITINGTLGDKFLIDTLKTFDKFDFVVGQKRVGKRFLVFNKWEPTVEAISYSPYTSQAYMNNISYENKNKKGDRIIKSITHSLALSAGFYIGSKIK